MQSRLYNNPQANFTENIYVSRTNWTWAWRAAASDQTSIYMVSPTMATIGAKRTLGFTRKSRAWCKAQRPFFYYFLQSIGSFVRPIRGKYSKNRILYSEKNLWRIFANEFSTKPSNVGIFSYSGVVQESNNFWFVLEIDIVKVSNDSNSLDVYKSLFLEGLAVTAQHFVFWQRRVHSSSHLFQTSLNKECALFQTNTISLNDHPTSFKTI